MNDQNKPNAKREEAPQTNPGGRAAAHSSSWKKLLSKKWVTPAAFMAAAAIIVTIMWVYQGSQPQQETATETSETEETRGETDVAVNEQDQDLPVTAIAGENAFQWPVLNKADVEVIVPFYEAGATGEERQAAMIQSGNTFKPHMGMDLAKADNTTFDVLSVLGGKVSHVEQHPLNGYVVEIAHADGLVTVYQSLTDVTVKTGDEVAQGTVIAKAGRSELEKDLGVHLHLEVRQDGEAVNPAAVLPE
ncbi:M23 family metallopeptidase [Paenibacillus sp. IB182496]|uniref:M23 family metallopeptidase n=1 Tax=Paenibacillus sabuli TaxID=2772509 RepID=A0A927GSN2_9BACL|nr:M23 family metallopeptidase [Paenibacillus sabuli]MBD2845867.1 M23 family metallopeptidase [Paenibacillus sabuli]